MLYYFSDDGHPPAPLPDDPHCGSHGECHEDDVTDPESGLLMPRELGGDPLLYRVGHFHGVATGDINGDGIATRDIGGIAKELLDVLVVPSVDIAVDGITTHVLTLVDAVVKPDTVMPLVHEPQGIGVRHRHRYILRRGASAQHHRHHDIRQARYQYRQPYA